MKKCPQCGTGNLEGAKFCKECGYPVNLEQESTSNVEEVDDMLKNDADMLQV